jgi:hypothetical protein
VTEQSLGRGIILPGVLMAIALAACGGHGATTTNAAITTVGSGREATATATAAMNAFPNSMVVLGHSAATGEDSDPSQPHVEVRANSWATGTNPAVDSVYLRVLAHNPAIKGHNFNLAQAGATVEQLYAQAQSAVVLKPTPQLFLIQTVDNDIVCPARPSDYARFRADLLAALRVISHGAPHARIYVVSQWGSPPTWWKALSLKQRRQYGTDNPQGPCQFLTASGNPIPREASRLDSIIHHYEAQLQAACAQVPRCTYDGGAFGRQIDRNKYISEDLNHFTIGGHAAAAKVAYDTMRRLGVLPSR